MPSTKSVIREIIHRGYRFIEASRKKQTLSDFGHMMPRENSLKMFIMLGMGGGTITRDETTSTMKDGINCITQCIYTQWTMYKIYIYLEEEGQDNHQKSDATWRDKVIWSRDTMHCK